MEVQWSLLGEAAWNNASFKQFGCRRRVVELPPPLRQAEPTASARRHSHPKVVKSGLAQCSAMEPPRARGGMVPVHRGASRARLKLSDSPFPRKVRPRLLCDKVTKLTARPAAQSRHLGRSPVDAGARRRIRAVNPEPA